jgi:hypothetical protein
MTTFCISAAYFLDARIGLLVSRCGAIVRTRCELA